MSTFISTAFSPRQQGTDHFTREEAIDYAREHYRYVMNIEETFQLLEKEVAGRRLTRPEIELFVKNPLLRCLKYHGYMVSYDQLERQDELYWLEDQEGLARSLSSEMRQSPIGVNYAPTQPILSEYLVTSIESYYLTGEFQFEKGTGAHPIEFNMEGKRIFISVNRLGDYRLVRKELSALLVNQLFFQGGTTGSFLSQVFYQENTVAYGTWSVRAHLAPIREVLLRVGAQLITVPGDGIGLVSRMYGGPVVAGDKYISTVTHPSVQQESITQTLWRGLDAGSTTLILSYVTPFLSPADYALVERFTTVYVIDVRPKQLSPEYVILGPGITAKGDTQILGVAPSQMDLSSAKVPYSENLLRLPDVVGIFSLSESVVYLCRMRPTVLILTLNPQLELPLRGYGIPYVTRGVPDVWLANTLEEYLDHQELCPYLVPIGNRPSVEELDLSQNYHRTRVIFSTRTGMGRMLAQEFGGITREKTYFYVSTEQEKRIDYEDMQSEEHRIIKFVDMVPETLPVLLTKQAGKWVYGSKAQPVHLSVGLQLFEKETTARWVKTVMQNVSDPLDRQIVELYLQDRTKFSTKYAKEWKDFSFKDKKKIQKGVPASKKKRK